MKHTKAELVQENDQLRSELESIKSQLVAVQQGLTDGSSVDLPKNAQPIKWKSMEIPQSYLESLQRDWATVVELFGYYDIVIDDTPDWQEFFSTTRDAVEWIDNDHNCSVRSRLQMLVKDLGKASKKLGREKHELVKRRGPDSEPKHLVFVDGDYLFGMRRYPNTREGGFIQLELHCVQHLAQLHNVMNQ